MMLRVGRCSGEGEGFTSLSKALGWCVWDFVGCEMGELHLSRCLFFFVIHGRAGHACHGVGLGPKLKIKAKEQTFNAGVYGWIYNYFDIG